MTDLPAVTLLLVLLALPAVALGSPKLTSADFPEKVPALSTCSQSELQRAHASVSRNIKDMRNGIMPSGTVVVAAINRMNSCDPETGFCIPLMQPKSEFSYTLSDSVKDPCVRYCAILHEWEHFIDERPWSMKSPDSELSIFWELLPYERQEQCLRKFVKAESANTPAAAKDSAKPATQPASPANK
ncbi:MAG TPA: hypothetical protein VFV50_18500 [Bdellovibrionales bacterium]|nr:hypothetical protein [Bdellovibrionales bacterium]